MGAQADARRKLGFIVALVVAVLVLAQWIWRRGDGDVPFVAALIFAVLVVSVVQWVLAWVLVFVLSVLEVLPGLAKFLRDLSGKNG